MYVFEDNSCWLGQWENDQPVEDGTSREFAARSACPQIYIDDLLRTEPCSSMAAKGNIFPARNRSVVGVQDQLLYVAIYAIKTPSVWPD